METVLPNIQSREKKKSLSTGFIAVEEDILSLYVEPKNHYKMNPKVPRS